MKTTQAWGWLAAGVLAAGLNASYHDGGLRVAHQVVSRLEDRSEAVLALASARTEQLLAETRWFAAKDEGASRRLSAALQRAQTRLARSNEALDQVEVISPGDEAQLAQFEANRDQIEAQIEQAQDRLQAAQDRAEARAAEMQARIQARVQEKMVRIRIPAVAVSPMVVNVPRIQTCSRIRVNVPRMPVVRIPSVPVIRVETSGTGPI